MKIKKGYKLVYRNNNKYYSTNLGVMFNKFYATIREYNLNEFTYKDLDKGALSCFTQKKYATKFKNTLIYNVKNHWFWNFQENELKKNLIIFKCEFIESKIKCLYSNTKNYLGMGDEIILKLEDCPENTYFADAIKIIKD